MAQSKFWRLNPAALPTLAMHGQCAITHPAELIQRLRPGHGIVLASWDETAQLGRVERLGITTAINSVVSEATVEWRPADFSLRPNPAGRRYWTQPSPYFNFAKPVAERYALEDLFAENIPEMEGMVFGAAPSPRITASRPSSSPTAGFVYVIKSPYGFKIGKTVNMRDRTRLFSVKLPFPISIEHYAMFDDYSQAERNFHQIFHAKRLEGEWFNLDDRDLATIRTYGKKVEVAGLTVGS